MALRSSDFDVEVTHRAVGFNLPQTIGRALWLPMWLMAVMAFPVALVLGIYRANLVAANGDAVTIAALGHFLPAAMFLGFSSVFAAITFAIARILGELRQGGGIVQEAAGRRVVTLRMPGTAKLFILLMAMAQMALVFAVIAHIVVGANTLSAGQAGLAAAESAAEWIEAVRRIGAATYLLSISLGLATIFKVLGFQAVRVRELPAEPRRAA